MKAIFLLVVIGMLLVIPGVIAMPEKTNGFVCPVFNPDSAVAGHNPNAVEISNGDYTIVGPEVSVPYGATNGDGDGAPDGDHSSPGDTDYTAVWAGD